jgi:fatty-acyl-CoA synthase
MKRAAPRSAKEGRGHAEPLQARRSFPDRAPLMLVTELIRRGALHHGERIALRFGDESRTFREVDRLSNRIAHTLSHGLGLARGTPIALLIDNGLDSVPCDFGCAKAGLTRTPLNGRLSRDEHVQMIAKIGARTMIYGPSQAERAAELTRALPELRAFGLGDASAGADLLALARDASDADPRLPLDPGDVVLALFTSGTTGTLKAVQHTHETYAAVVRNVLLNLIDPKPGETMLHAASMIHASGCFVLPYWLRGGTAAVLPGFAPGAYLEAIERWRPDALTLVPTMLQMLFQTPGIDAADLSSVGTIVYGTSPMPRPVLERALDLWGPVFVQFYGQTEAPLAICNLKKEEHVGAAPERLLSCGRPSLDCELRLVDEAGEDVAPGEPGEIVLRAPFAMRSYTDENLTAQAFLPGRWLRTRDVGRFDEEGYLTLIDRTSDMIVTGGYNVYPREVEDALAGHPAVAQAVVVGLPDDVWGEAVTAFVVPREGEGCDEAALIAHVRACVAAYKAPKSVRFVESIPLSAVGKPLRRALREPFWQGKERRI